MLKFITTPIIFNDNNNNNNRHKLFRYVRLTNYNRIYNKKK